MYLKLFNIGKNINSILSMKDKIIFYIGFICLFGTIGIWLPWLMNVIIAISNYGPSEINMSFLMYSMPMIISICGEKMIFDELSKSKKMYYTITLIISFLLCLILILLIQKGLFCMATYLSVILFIGALFLSWIRIDVNKFDNNSALGGSTN